ncbi:MAG: Na/Pi symporter, partial [Lentisphaerae bacterium]|nr:Na/Pi symporter [Lentisphaerota bacterium]
MPAPEFMLEAIFWLIGGLSLFLYGITIMSESLQRTAGIALRKGLHHLTRTRFHGLCTGAIITALVQSSSATTVMIVGFISAGLLTFQQSISLILGANIGTTFTSQIVALDLENLAVPLLGIGFLTALTAHKRVVHEFGIAVMGFGMLFFGLMLMRFSVESYNTSIKGWLHMAAT